jgi:hypothetical protein
VRLIRGIVLEDESGNMESTGELPLDDVTQETIDELAIGTNSDCVNTSETRR